MIESLINLKEMERKPALAFVWALLVGSIGIIAASQIQSIKGVDFGFFSVLFVIIPSVYFLTSLIRREERNEEKQSARGYISFWDTHGKDILILLFYFFGLTIAFAVWSFFLPSQFQTQLDKITDIRGTGAFTQEAALSSIFINNLQVMLMSFLFSLIFGTGAIFIIVWNASVLGVFIGEYSTSLAHIPIVSASFLPHGIPEIGGYLTAALAGGIVSAAILRGKHGVLHYILLDSAKLMLLGFVLIAVGAVVEVYL